jgi:hypothetical protein
VGYMILVVVDRVENIDVGHMIRLATLEKLLWLVILGWTDSPDDAMILVGVLILWWRKAFGTKNT